MQKTFFMVFFSGAVLGDKVSKIATYFGATLYKYPSTALDHAAMTYEVHKRKAESAQVLESSARPPPSPAAVNRSSTHPPPHMSHSQVLEQSTAILRGALTSLAAAYGPWARHVHDMSETCP